MTPRPLNALASSASLCLALVAGSAQAAEGIDSNTRLEGLEVRLDALTHRVQALETMLKEAGPGVGSAPGSKGEPAWDFDDYTQGSPFKVLQQSLDRTNGRVDLLLDVVGPVPDVENWAAVARSEPVPLILTADRGDGLGGQSVPLRLERAKQIVPGARLHVTATIDAAHAKLVRRIRVAHAPAESSATVTGQ
ncbi:MAG: hypothetical protein WAM94_07230 [Chromatiaceae bacterium]